MTEKACRCGEILESLSGDGGFGPPAPCPRHGIQFVPQDRACKACGDYTTTGYCSRQCAANRAPTKVVELKEPRPVDHIEHDPFASGFRSGVLEGYKEAIEAIRARAEYMKKMGYTESSILSVRNLAYWLENREDRPKE